MSAYQERPDFVLFSLYIDDFAAGIVAAGEAKQRWPQATTVVGGPHVTLLGDTVREITSVFDEICFGDTLDQCVRTLLNKHTGVAIPEAQPLYDLWRGSKYFPVTPVETMRGCQHHCPFCTDPVLRRGATPVSGLNSLPPDPLTGADGRLYVRFVDSSFTSGGEQLDRTLADLTTHRQTVWSAYGYARDITEDLADRLAESGCAALFLGIESLSPKVSTGKRFVKDVTRVERAVRTLQCRGIFVHCNFILGLPGETYESFSETLQALDVVRPDSVGGGPFYLTPGSIFEKFPARFGIQILDVGWAARQHIDFYNPQSYFRTSTLTQEDMAELAQQMREFVQRSQMAWNLSDYALLSWLSVGGARTDLTEAWNGAAAHGLSQDQLAVLAEKRETNSCAPNYVAQLRRSAVSAGSGV
jgi:radical SAM superfamily enzyme YgiQ (UPF0313 family)